MIARLATGTALAAEALALYVFAEFLAAGYSGSHPHAISGVAFVAVALVAFELPRFLGGWECPRRAGLALTAAAAYVVLYGVVRIETAGDVAIWDLAWVADFIRDPEDTVRAGAPAITGTLLLLTAWVRGAIRSERDVELELVPRELGWPFILVTCVLVLGAAGGRSSEVARAGAAFYGVAILALASSQLALSGATIGEVRAGGITAALFGVTTAATLACLLVFGLFFSAFGGPLGRALGETVDIVLTIVLTPFAWLLEQFLRLILPDGANIPQIVEANRARIGDAKSGGPGDQSAVQQGATYLFRIVALAVMVAAAALIAVVFVRLRRQATVLEGQLPLTTSVAGAGADLRRGLRSLFRGRTPAPGPPAGSAAIQLYVEVLRQAQQSGRPRPAGRTAGEFAPTLAETFHTGITDEITHAFEQARYAGREPDPRMIAGLESQWRASRS